VREGSRTGFRPVPCGKPHLRGRAFPTALDPSAPPGDGSMLPPSAGCHHRGRDAEVFLELSGRTVFDDEGDRQLLFATFEAEDSAYAWLNDVICVGEGRIDPGTFESRIDISVCEPDRRLRGMTSGSR
jgi:hypothetical protein